jgi:L-alanine-DL-glutamate epimerase-like enolase superfamily enzyme
MQIAYKEIELPFEFPFTISKGTKTHQPSLILRLEHAGRQGFGEAPAIAYYQVTTASMAQTLERYRKQIESFVFTDPERFWHFLHHLMPGEHFLICALDMAGWDLFGKINRKNLGELIGSKGSKEIETDYTIGIDEPEKMLEKIDKKPWPAYKIKLGTDHDVEIVELIRKHTHAALRIDANAAWTETEALEKIKRFSALGVELIEQPLAKDDWQGMQRLYRQSPIPLLADESCVTEKDVRKCVGHFHGINIKLTKCGGITPALRMIDEARDLGLQIMIGSMNETTIGTAALVHLKNLCDYADADGPLLLADDVATGLHYHFGQVTANARPGLGIDTFLFD